VITAGEAEESGVSFKLMDLFAKRMSAIACGRGGLSGKERASRLLRFHNNMR
jgi:hypothetical protein